MFSNTTKIAAQRPKNKKAELIFVSALCLPFLAAILIAVLNLPQYYYLILVAFAAPAVFFSVNHTAGSF